MDTVTPPADAQRPSIDPDPPAPPVEALSRRTLLRVAGGGLVAAGVAACAPVTVRQATWTYPPGSSSGPTLSAAPSGSAAPSASASAASSAEPSMSHAPSASPSASAPAMDHDANALAVVERFLGGEGASLPDPGNVPLEPKIVDGVKVFDMTVEEIQHQIDAEKDPIAGLGFNGTWPGPRSDRRRGRSSPGDLQEQHEGVDRDPFPRSAAAEQHGRRPARHAGPDPARRLLHLRVHRPDARLAHVPHVITTRRTRSAADCSGRSSSSRPTPHSATTSSTAQRRTSSGSATTRSAGSRSTAAASRRPHRSSRRSARRSSSGS